MDTLESKLNHMNFILKEIGMLRKKIRDHGTGSIRTTINTLEDRVNEIQKDMLEEEGKK
jgi:hypothetical protein|tara:strand:- start:46 stop:222 length:177 start_codon:yes stop_codon:yes gene_type:complete